MAAELIVVLDVDRADEALAIVDACGACQWFKVGAQLFTREGPAVVRAIQGRGKSVFLDLKYHDIPNTVAHAARAAADLGVGLFTLHASGGRRMIEAARAAVEGSPTRILAVTILTSFSDAALRADIGLHETAAEAVPRLARLATESGAHGLVCSPHEIVAVRGAVGEGPHIVTPGVRPVWAGKDDQERVMTPAEAAAHGADFLVVGRPILKHANPAEAVRLVLEEIQ
jgi:orotidine-5'-phosphate decarboxylase